MSIAGFNKKIQVKTTAAGTFDDVPGNTGTLNFSGELLDDTTFNSTGFRSRLRGLKDYSLSVTAVFSVGDAALNTIRDALFNDTTLDMNYLPNGTNGFTGQVKVESFSLNGDVGGMETIDITMQAESALSTV